MGVVSVWGYGSQWWRAWPWDEQIIDSFPLSMISVLLPAPTYGQGDLERCMWQNFAPGMLLMYQMHCTCQSGKEWMYWLERIELFWLWLQLVALSFVLDSDAHSTTSSASPAQSPSYSNQSDEGSDSEMAPGSGRSPVFSFLDLTYWKRWGWVLISMCYGFIG